MYDGSHQAMDNVFPADGVVRIKKAPDSVKGDSPELMQESMAKHKCPIQKQRVILKPSKFKLPKTADILEEENFSDVIYDSDNERKRAAHSSKK